MGLKSSSEALDDGEEHKHNQSPPKNTINEANKYISDKVVMHISIHDVISMDIDSQSDPFVVVYQMDMTTESFKEIGRTEVMEDTHDADFVKEFIIPYIFNEYQLFRFDVYDSDSKSNDLSQHDYLGSSTFILGEIIHERGSIQTKKLLDKNGSFYKNKKTKKYSTITIYVDTNHNENLKDEMIEKFVQFDIKITSNLSANNTFCEIYRMDDAKNIKVYNTEIVSNIYTPKYNSTYIDTFSLCRSDYEKQLKFIIYQHFTNKDDKVIYSEIITMNDILQNKENKFSKNKLCLENIRVLNFTFTDYLYDNFDISVLFGIDFTASNGDPEEPYSLHYIYDKHKLSPYQIAIRAIGNIIASYDSDNKFPVYGFGAKLFNDNDFDDEKYSFEELTKNKKTNFVFPINNNEEDASCQGIFNVESEYRNILQSNKLVLSAPTNFAPMLQKVIDSIEEADKNEYFIFLIITDGQITDIKETKKLIEYAANKPLPLSIIIIGVGDDDFDNMIELDGDDGTLGKRDIVQFVEMNEYIHKTTNEIDKNRLSMDVLFEVPNQLLSYMTITGYEPNLEAHKNTSNQNVQIGTMYNLNLDDYDEKDKEEKDNQVEEQKLDKHSPEIMKITHDTPIPFGWDKCYDIDGNIYILNDKNKRVNNDEFFNKYYIDYNNKNMDKKNWLYPEVDLVFCLDVTGSMQNEIDACKESIKNIVETIKNDENAHIQFGYVAYRDYPSQESTFVTKTHSFTSNIKKMKEYLELYNAKGGGDCPEAVADGLNESLLLKGYRKKAIKMIILITDAPPHGIGCSGDGIPNGPPNGLNIIEIANNMKKQGILLYILGCEPDLKDNRARDVYRALCQITYGKYIGIIDEKLIAPIITKAVAEEINSQKLQYMVKHAVIDNNLDINDNESVLQYLSKKLNKKQKLMQIEDIYGNYDESNKLMIINECKNLKQIKNKYKSQVTQPSIKRNQSNKIKLEMKDIDNECIDKIIARIKAQS